MILKIMLFIFPPLCVPALPLIVHIPIFFFIVKSSNVDLSVYDFQPQLVLWHIALIFFKPYSTLSFITCTSVSENLPLYLMQHPYSIYFHQAKGL